MGNDVVMVIQRDCSANCFYFLQSEKAERKVVKKRLSRAMI